jgi:hypothetical protein
MLSSFSFFQNDENVAPNTAAATMAMSQSVPNFDVDVHRLLDMLQLPETIDGLYFLFFALYIYVFFEYICTEYAF